jgi:hypothetical protein
MQKHQKYEDHLMQAIGFDEADLEANRAGQLTYRQLNRLKSASVLATLGWGISALVAAVGLMILLLMTQSIEKFPADVTFLLVASGGGVIGGLILYFGLKAKRLSTDLREKRLTAVEGRIDLSLTGGQYTSYTIRVADLHFPAKKEAFLAFKNGDPYRIYYAPHTKRILSVEWLREDDNLL